VEETYRELPDELRRDKAKDYGLSYVFRKNELREISVLENGLEESKV
jgi:hypothetical protein